MMETCILATQRTSFATNIFPAPFFQIKQKKLPSFDSILFPVSKCPRSAVCFPPNGKLWKSNGSFLLMTWRQLNVSASGKCVSNALKIDAVPADFGKFRFEHKMRSQSSSRVSEVNAVLTVSAATPKLKGYLRGDLSLCLFNK